MCGDLLRKYIEEHGLFFDPQDLETIDKDAIYICKSN